MPELERIQQNTPGTLSQQWYEDGTAVDPGTVTIGITRWDGTVLVAAGTATTGAGTAARSFNLTTTHTALLDRLTVTWTSTLKGTVTSYVEVVGGFHFTISQARAIDPLQDTARYTPPEIIEARLLAENALEDACGRAFVPRYTLRRVNGLGGNILLLPDPGVTAVRTVSVDGVAFTSTELADLVVGDDGTVYSPSRWTTGTRNYLVGYEHGDAFCPPLVAKASMLLAKRHLVTSSLDERYTSITDSETGETFGLVTPGIRGALFDIPLVNSVVSQYRVPAIA